MKVLSTCDISVTASGKAILIGEHSVVYGHKAIAMALPDIKLTMTLLSGNNEASNWNDKRVWQTTIQGKKVEVEDKIIVLLIKAFEKALSLFRFTGHLSDFAPQKIQIDSQIPLGGGMGGSAAISTCFVRIAAQISAENTNRQVPFEHQIQFANEVDSLFHSGKASGLDVSAVASDGIIEFQKDHSPKKINNQCHFWLALVDSGERSETAEMIEKVKNNLSKNKKFVENLFDKLGQLATISSLSLQQGNLNEFTSYLNEAHECLRQIGVSTDKIDEMVGFLKSRGALSAKLTGAGGGGLVLAVFEEKPEFLFTEYPKDAVFISKV